MEDSMSSECLQKRLLCCLQVVRQYDWLINAYVLDYYVDNHWEKLPRCWRSHLENVQLEELSTLLNFNDSAEQHHANVWPLTLLALRRLLQELCLPRRLHKNTVELSKNRSALLNHPKLKHVFNKCVKPKKRHEIDVMGPICEYSQQRSPVDYVVDFGAGLGHLARVLGYGYGKQVCCLEMRTELNVQARCMDENFELFAEKHLPPMKRANLRRPEHVTLCLTSDMQPEQFLSIIAESLQRTDTNFQFGIIGLHPCGDLAVILMRMFINSPQARFLNFASCCYMKLSTAETQSNAQLHGYPLSRYMRQRAKLAHLSYEAREISCHAMEMYCDRLAKGDYEHLKVHAFRAATERILVKHWPDLKHCGLRNVKHVPGMQFEDYFYKAVQGLEAANLQRKELQSAVTQNDLRHWRRIVIFYTLRLMFAPLVESIILYDRALYLQENHCQVKIHAVFDPRLSPRNHITCAFKTS
ncbi:methyltransferase-like protein 25B isoform X1 [Anastrepha ludens]|uniref:methyltransferase-like protein 25B isoform X1 n=1 Tax=Anastrepha ludens TaxID=28586 RepID=UPI0023AF7D27|nr:methyltransferase-like protein 25B isoform X1 [Anastrepha ludens]